jgi:hypothetical protein
MTMGEVTALPFPKLADAYADLAFFGPALDIRLPEPLFAGSAAEALVQAFPCAVLASAIVRNAPSGLPSNLPPPPEIPFRAAAVANMIYRPIPGGAVPSFEWQIGELHWLPAVRNKKEGRAVGG